MTEIITTAAELDALLMAVSECAEAAVIQTADRRPYIITEDDSGTFWADSYWQEDEARGPWAAESIPLPWTVLYRPDAEPALVKPSREDVARTLFQWDIAPDHHQPHPLWDDPHSARLRDLWLSAADAVLALLPGRAVEEVKAEALEGMAKWFQIASRLGTGEPDALAAQACAEAAARLRGESDV